MGASRSLVTLILALSVAASPGSTLPEGIRVDLAHVDSAGNFTWLEKMQRALSRGSQRMSALVAAQVPVTAGSGEFIVDLAIGTPSVPFPAIIDTGSDLIWTQCQPCADCYRQGTAIFNPSTSRTYARLSCSSKLCRALPVSDCRSSCEYIYSYGDYSSTQGVLATETFTMGEGVLVPRVGFGCGVSNQGEGFQQAAGLVGLGRGPLSLVSQLRVGRFSYCLTRLDETKKSPLFLGSLASLDISEEAKSTPFLRNPNQPTFYYLSLKGITVGTRALRIPVSTFALNDDGTGGLIIDSGTSITYLEFEGYRLLKQALLLQVNLPLGDGSSVGLDLCFQVPAGASLAALELPKIIFHFDGADLVLPPENYMAADASSGLLCLAVMGSSGISILGNFQQQSFHMLYDLEGDNLSFQKAQCDQL